MSWDTMQKEVSTWATRNFGDTPAWMPMLGLVEEVGEYYAAKAQGCREEQLDAIGDQVVYVLNLCEKVGLSFAEAIASHKPGPHQFETEELMGVLGVGCQAILKNAQAIRDFTWLKRRDRLGVCLAMWFGWVAWECKTLGVDPYQVSFDVWSTVKLRDWVKNPSDANKVNGSKA